MRAKTTGGPRSVQAGLFGSAPADGRHEGEPEGGPPCLISRLAGCKPEPLVNYLKALGVFRLVAEQTDSEAQLSWPDGIAHLHSKLDRVGLTSFFLEQYRPSPILAPWNGGSGFYGGGAEPLNAITESKGNRLALYRDTIARIRTFAPRASRKTNRRKHSWFGAAPNLPTISCHGSTCASCWAKKSQTISPCLAPAVTTAGSTSPTILCSG